MNKEAEMYNPQIVYSEKEEVTVVPGVILNKLIPFMEENKIEYRTVPQSEFEDGWPGGCVYRGRPRINGVAAVVAKVDTECLHKIAEDLLHVSANYPCFGGRKVM